MQTVSFRSAQLPRAASAIYSRARKPCVVAVSRGLTVRCMAVRKPDSGTGASGASTSKPFEQLNDVMLLAAASMTPLLLGAEPALAKNRELGILEGRIFSLAHPVVMGGLFAMTLYAAYLGFAWREVRTIPEAIKELKTQLPAADEEGNRPPSEAQTRITELETKRKEMISKKFNDRHNAIGSLLLGSGVLFAVAGAFNTFIRTGKLFPGPHLYAGAAIVVLWALAASLVPYMQKGNKLARDTHIALNVANLALFAWQIPTGWDIVLKVLQFTELP